ncbi:MAG: type VI secretion system lipoprotein TssJ [Rhodospirillales bacterium]|nr:type VI secretion system lipoprotein TssJ [Rhodospirillales bacterium]
MIRVRNGMFAVAADGRSRGSQALPHRGIGRRAALGVALALPLGLAGCASGPPAPAVLTLTVHGGANQNPDPLGHAAPVAFRLYQLTATSRFDRADVFALLEHKQQTLGADALASEEFLVTPGQTRTITRTLQKGTGFVGIAVLFREIDHAVWRLTSPVAASGPTNLTLTISGLKASLAGGGS